MTAGVLLVDDHPLYRRGLALLLEEEGIAVLGQASTVREGLRLADRLRPDVVTMDLHLPDGSGVQATRDLLAALPGTGVLVLTMDSSDAAVLGALRAGARGYLLKDSAPEDVVRAVGAVVRGELVVAPELAARMPALLAGGSLRTPAGLEGLTGRESDVLRQVAHGRSNAEIGRALFVAEKTVRNHVTALLTKTGVGNRAALTSYARDLGL